MSDHSLDGSAAGSEILTRIEVIGMLSKVLTNARGECEAEVGVDVDLADGASGGLTELLLGNTDGIGHLSAVLVDHINKLLGNAGGAVKNYGEAGQTLSNLVENVETERRRHELAGLGIAGALLCSELISAVARSDGDGKGVASGALNELLNVLRTGVGGILSGNVDLVLYSGESAKLGLNYDAVIMGVLNDLLGDLDVLLEGKSGLVDHNGGEAAVDAALAELEAVAVVEMDNDGEIKAGSLLCIGNRCLDELHKINVLCIVAGALGDLEDKRSTKLDSGLGDALNYLHVVNVESADSVTAVIGFLEHFGRGDYCHIYQLLRISFRTGYILP